MKNQKINIHKEANINAIGKHNSGHCKPIICLETGDIYSSMTDAANAAGVHYSMMSGHLTGRYKSVKKKHYDYLSNVIDNPDVMFARVREMFKLAEDNAKVAADNAEDARKWREYQAAEEKRLEDERKAREEHAAKKTKAEARVKRLQDKCNRIEIRLKLNQNKLLEAQKELDELNEMEVTAA